MPHAPAATNSDSTATASTPTGPVVVVFKSDAEHVGDSADTEGTGLAADEGEGDVAPAGVGEEADTTTAEASMGDKPVTTTSVEEQEDEEAGGTVRTGGRGP